MAAREQRSFRGSKATRINVETKKRYVRLIPSSLNENSNRGQTLWPETDLSRTAGFPR